MEKDEIRELLRSGIAMCPATGLLVNPNTREIIPMPEPMSGLAKALVNQFCYVKQVQRMIDDNLIPVVGVSKIVEHEDRNSGEMVPVVYTDKYACINCSKGRDIVVALPAEIAPLILGVDIDEYDFVFIERHLALELRSWLSVLGEKSNMFNTKVEVIEK